MGGWERQFETKSRTILPKGLIPKRKIKKGWGVGRIPWYQDNPRKPELRNNKLMKGYIKETNPKGYFCLKIKL